MNGGNDPEFLANPNQAGVLTLVRKLGQAGMKITDSPLEKQLRSQLGATGLAGVHILLSFELMLEGRTLDDTIREHQRMVEILRRVLTEHLRASGALTDVPFPSPPDEGHTEHPNKFITS